MPKFRNIHYPTVGSLADKVEWEGGVLDALEYGIKSSDIGPTELRVLWAELESHHRAMQPLVQKIEELLEDDDD